MRDTRADSGRRGTGGGGTSRGRGGHQREPAQNSAPRRNSQAAYERPQAQGGYDRPATKLKFRLTPAGAGIMLLAVLVVVAIFAGIFKNAEKNSYFSQTITAGVTINGKDYSGWKEEDLRKQLEAEYNNKINDINIKITWQDKSWTLGGADLGATHDADEVISKAALLARTGNEKQRIEEAKRIKAEGQKFTVMLTIDPAPLKARLEEIALEIGTQGHNASALFNPHLVDFDIPENIEDLKPTQQEIEKMFIINPETPGKTVDVDMMAQKIMDGLKAGSKVELELLVNDFIPSISEAKIRESFHLLNAYRTKLSGTSTKERNENIALALSKFNGLTLAPGEVISFNETTGERSEANGYQLAPTIGGDKALVDDFGGGVCQASTTLYNCALMAGCEVLDRGHHSIPSAYALEGFDAMVNYPNADLTFKNTSKGPMYIKAYLKKPYVYVMFFGLPLPDGQSIARYHEMEEGETPEAVVEVDKKGTYNLIYDDEKYEYRKSHPSLKVKTYLIIKDKNGNEIDRKYLYTDTFKEIVGLTYVGKTPRATDPQPTPDKGKGDHGDG